MYGLTAGVVLLVLVVLLWGGGDVRNTLAGADRTLAGWALAVFVLQIPLLAFRWWIGMRLLGIRTGLLPLLRASCAAGGINFFAPGHFGEPLAAAWLERTGRGPGVEAFGVLIATKAVATMLAFAVLLLCLVGLGVGDRKVLLALGVGVLGGLFGLWWILSSDRLSTAMVTLVHRCVVRWAWASATVSRAETVLGRFRRPFQVFSARPAAVAIVAGLSVVKMALVTVSVSLVFQSVGQPMGAKDALLMQAIDSVGHLASVWVPGEMGVQEFVLTGSATTLLGVPGPTATAAALLQKAVLFSHVCLGGLVFLLTAPWDRGSPQEP